MPKWDLMLEVGCLLLGIPIKVDGLVVIEVKANLRHLHTFWETCLQQAFVKKLNVRNLAQNE